MMIAVLTFALSACGGGGNDANNAIMQEKFDQADALMAQIEGWYEENGYMEGDAAAEVDATLDVLRAPLAETKALHEDILADGGYTEEDLVKAEASIDQTIAALEDIISEQEAYDASAESGEGLGALGEKYNQLYDIVMEASELATANGWDADEAYVSELNAVLVIMEQTKADLDNPDTMDDEYVAQLSLSFDELITVWQSYLAQVSEPYAAN